LSIGIRFGPTPRKSSKTIRDSRQSSRVENEKNISLTLFTILKTNIEGKRRVRRNVELHVRDQGRDPRADPDEAEAEATIGNRGNLELSPKCSFILFNYFHVTFILSSHQTSTLKVS